MGKTSKRPPLKKSAAAESEPVAPTPTKAEQPAGPEKLDEAVVVAEQEDLPHKGVDQPIISGMAEDADDDGVVAANKMMDAASPLFINTCGSSTMSESIVDVPGAPRNQSPAESTLPNDSPTTTTTTTHQALPRLTPSTSSMQSCKSESPSESATPHKETPKKGGSVSSQNAEVSTDEDGNDAGKQEEEAEEEEGTPMPSLPTIWQLPTKEAVLSVLLEYVAIKLAEGATAGMKNPTAANTKVENAFRKQQKKDLAALISESRDSFNTLYHQQEQDEDSDRKNDSSSLSLIHRNHLKAIRNSLQDSQEAQTELVAVLERCLNEATTTQEVPIDSCSDTMPSVDMLGQYYCRLTESILSTSSSGGAKKSILSSGEYPEMPQHALGWEAVTWSVPIWNGIQGAVVDLVKELAQLEGLVDRTTRAAAATAAAENAKKPTSTAVSTASKSSSLFSFGGFKFGGGSKSSSPSKPLSSSAPPLKTATPAAAPPTTLIGMINALFTVVPHPATNTTTSSSPTSPTTVSRTPTSRFIDDFLSSTGRVVEGEPLFIAKKSIVAQCVKEMLTMDPVRSYSSDSVQMEQYSTSLLASTWQNVLWAVVGGKRRPAAPPPSTTPSPSEPSSPTTLQTANTDSNLPSAVASVNLDTQPSTLHEYLANTPTAAIWSTPSETATSEANRIIMETQHWGQVEKNIYSMFEASAGNMFRIPPDVSNKDLWKRCMLQNGALNGDETAKPNPATARAQEIVNTWHSTTTTGSISPKAQHGAYLSSVHRAVPPTRPTSTSSAVAHQLLSPELRYNNNSHGTPTLEVLSRVTAEFQPIHSTQDISTTTLHLRPILHDLAGLVFSFVSSVVGRYIAVLQESHASLTAFEQGFVRGKTVEEELVAAKYVLEVACPLSRAALIRNEHWRSEVDGDSKQNRTNAEGEVLAQAAVGRLCPLPLSWLLNEYLPWLLQGPTHNQQQPPTTTSTTPSTAAPSMAAKSWSTKPVSFNKSTHLPRIRPTTTTTIPAAGGGVAPPIPASHSRGEFMPGPIPSWEYLCSLNPAIQLTIKETITPNEEADPSQSSLFKTVSEIANFVPCAFPKVNITFTDGIKDTNGGGNYVVVGPHELQDKVAAFARLPIDAVYEGKEVLFVDHVFFRHLLLKFGGGPMLVLNAPTKEVDCTLPILGILRGNDSNSTSSLWGNYIGGSPLLKRLIPTTNPIISPAASPTLTSRPSSSPSTPSAEGCAVGTSKLPLHLCRFVLTLDGDTISGPLKRQLRSDMYKKIARRLKMLQSGKNGGGLSRITSSQALDDATGSEQHYDFDDIDSDEEDAEDDDPHHNLRNSMLRGTCSSLTGFEDSTTICINPHNTLLSDATILAGHSLLRQYTQKHRDQILKKDGTETFDETRALLPLLQLAFSNACGYRLQRVVTIGDYEGDGSTNDVDINTDVHFQCIPVSTEITVKEARLASAMLVDTSTSSTVKQNQKNDAEVEDDIKDENKSVPATSSSTILKMSNIESAVSTFLIVLNVDYTDDDERTVRLFPTAIPYTHCIRPARAVVAANIRDQYLKETAAENKKPAAGVQQTATNSLKGIPGAVGLSNIGNTCYMNSGLQCLMNLPRLRQAILTSLLSIGGYGTAGGNTAHNVGLTRAFRALLRFVWSAGEAPFDVSIVKEENDAHELAIKPSRFSSFGSSSIVKKASSSSYYSSDRVVATSEMMRAVKEEFSLRNFEFRGYEQHDASLFVSAFVETLLTETKMVAPLLPKVTCLQRGEPLHYREHKGGSGGSANDQAGHQQLLPPSSRYVEAAAYWRDYLLSNPSPVARHVFGLRHDAFHCLTCGAETHNFDQNSQFLVPLEDAGEIKRKAAAKRRLKCKPISNAEMAVILRRATRRCQQSSQKQNIKRAEIDDDDKFTVDDVTLAKAIHFEAEDRGICVLYHDTNPLNARLVSISGPLPPAVSIDVRAMLPSQVELAVPVVIPLSSIFKVGCDGNNNSADSSGLDLGVFGQANRRTIPYRYFVASIRQLLRRLLSSLDVNNNGNTRQEDVELCQRSCAARALQSAGTATSHGKLFHFYIVDVSGGGDRISFLHPNGAGMEEVPTISHHRYTILPCYKLLPSPHSQQSSLPSPTKQRFINVRCTIIRSNVTNSPRKGNTALIGEMAFYQVPVGIEYGDDDCDANTVGNTVLAHLLSNSSQNCSLHKEHCEMVFSSPENTFVVPQPLSVHSDTNGSLPVNALVNEDTTVPNQYLQLVISRKATTPTRASDQQLPEVSTKWQQILFDPSGRIVPHSSALPSLPHTRTYCYPKNTNTTTTPNVWNRNDVSEEAEEEGGMERATSVEECLYQNLTSSQLMSSPTSTLMMQAASFPRSCSDTSLLSTPHKAPQQPSTYSVPAVAEKEACEAGLVTTENGSGVIALTPQMLLSAYHRTTLIKEIIERRRANNKKTPLPSRSTTTATTNSAATSYSTTSKSPSTTTTAATTSKTPVWSSQGKGSCSPTNLSPTISHTISKSPTATFENAPTSPSDAVVVVDSCSIASTPEASPAMQIEECAEEPEATSPTNIKGARQAEDMEELCWEHVMEMEDVSDSDAEEEAKAAPPIKQSYSWSSSYSRAPPTPAAVPPPLNLLECLGETQQLLARDERWMCPNCEEKRDALSNSQPAIIPPCLLITFKRFSMCPTTFNLIKNNRLCYFPLKIDMRQFLAPEDNFAPLAAKSLEEADTQFNLCPTLHQLKGVVPLSTTSTSLPSSSTRTTTSTGITPSARLEEFLSTPLCEAPVLPSSRDAENRHSSHNLKKTNGATATAVTPETASTLTDLQFLCPNLYHFLRKELPESCTGYSQSDASYNNNNTNNETCVQENNNDKTNVPSATRGGSGRGFGGRGKRGRETSSNGTSSPCVSASHTPFALSPPNPTDTLTAAGTTTTTTSGGDVEAFLNDSSDEDEYASSPFVQPPLSFKYALRGVVYHSGSLNGGHYTAACYSSEARQWLNYNDSSVSACEDFKIEDVGAGEKKVRSGIEEKPEVFGYHIKPSPSCFQASSTTSNSTLNNLGAYHPPVGNAFMVFYERVSEDEFASIPAHKYDYYTAEDDGVKVDLKTTAFGDTTNEVRTFVTADLIERLRSSSSSGIQTVSGVAKTLTELFPATTSSFVAEKKKTTAATATSAEANPDTDVAELTITPPLTPPPFKAPGGAKKKLDAGNFALDDL